MMMEFTATNEWDYTVGFFAESWDDAHKVCAWNGWTLDGEIVATIPADQTTVQEMQAFVDRRNAGLLDS